ncbi:iron ABC transporter permease [Desulfohalobiaceae bacterium Ax17]|uniref:FecCD family ABC transporter permease n=1 Tax=Desulfovulcanus ferrireducens TaxID=2831190 RepID=UPI00207BCA4C|nr:iron ABC transporter permease [Desulfovulcanus ferrireducens]
MSRLKISTSFSLYVLLLMGLSLISILGAIYLGPLSIPWSKVSSCLWHVGVQDSVAPRELCDPNLSLIIWHLRMPRAILAFLVGSSLALSGAVFQGLLQNHLADPFTIGVSTGSAFGASLAIFFGLTSLFGPVTLPIFALCGAGLALTIVLGLGYRGGKLSKESLVLAGIVVATFLSALISLLKSLDEESVAGIVFWIMGSFQGRSWEHVSIFLPYYIPACLIILFWARELDILSLGDIHAKTLGLNPNRVRLFLLAGASLLTGAAVSVSGVIGFVGLIIPHLIRLSIGSNHKKLLPLSALLGGNLMIWADILARTILSGGEELPVGVLTALLGGPFFCLLLVKKFKA